MNFGERLKAQRKKSRLSGEALGKKLQPPVSKQTIAHWEHNRYKPNVDDLAQLCRILGISADELLMGAPGPLAMQIASAYEALGAAEKAQLNSFFLTMASGGKSQPLLLVNSDIETDVKKSRDQSSAPYSGSTESDSSAKNSDKARGKFRAATEDLRDSSNASNKHVGVPRKRGGRST